jgi:REP element-mobilizing transposase RayT
MKWKNHRLENAQYFIMTTLRKFIPLFTDDKVVSFIYDSLNYLRRNKGLKVYAYVIMPEHLHLVAGCGSDNINSLLGDFKSYTSRRIAEYIGVKDKALFDELQKAAYAGQKHAAWQETFRSEVIFETYFLKQKVDYIHNNPVRRGLVELPGDWKHSSYKCIEDDGVLDDIVFKVDSFDG